MKSIRLFVGAQPDQELLNEFSRNIEYMKLFPWARNVRWVVAKNIHMTLKFIGNLERHLVDELIDELRANLLLEPVTYQIDCIQVFPSTARPRVIAALVENNERLNELVRNLEQATLGYSSAAKRDLFRGHFSLARCGMDFPRELVFEPIPLGMMGELTGVTLYRSDTRPTGAVYTPIETFSFRVNN